MWLRWHEIPQTGTYDCQVTHHTAGQPWLSACLGVALFVKKKKKRPNSHVPSQHTEKWKQHNSTWENLATTTLSWPLASERVPWMVAASFTVHTISPLLFPFCKISLPESILFRHCTFISVGHFCLSTAWFHNCRVGAAWVMGGNMTTHFPVYMGTRHTCYLPPYVWYVHPRASSKLRERGKGDQNCTCGGLVLFMG